MHPTHNLRFSIPNPAARRRAAFTLIELLAVVAIISLMVAATLPVIKSLTKSNDQKQAANLARSMIASARNYALSQHRMAGVVFFEEGNTGYSSNSRSQGQSAMELFVEDYDQTTTKHPNANAVINAGIPVFISASPRQYLPGSIKVVSLDGVNLGVDKTRSRAVLFDANGQLLTRSGLGSDPAYSANSAGDVDWQFISSVNTSPLQDVSTTNSSPGIFLYNKAEFASANLSGPVAILGWLQQNSDIIIVNVYTGTVIR